MPTTKKQRKPRLTKKQAGFVKDFLEHGNGTKAALANYDTTDPKTASAIASENLDKPIIRKTLEEVLADDNLAEKHQQLINATQLTRLTFDANTTDAEIEEVVAQMPGHTLLKIIRKSSMTQVNGEITFNDPIAYVMAPDNTTQDKALDKAYKIKGTYAPEKHAHGHFILGDEHRNKATKAIKEILS